jgi:hypothetical protein
MEILVVDIETTLVNSDAIVERLALSTHKQMK